MKTQKTTTQVPLLQMCTVCREAPTSQRAARRLGNVAALVERQCKPFCLVRKRARGCETSTKTQSLKSQSLKSQSLKSQSL